jgi:tetratricopeptide (TPR) repeat protein
MKGGKSRKKGRGAMLQGLAGPGVSLGPQLRDRAYFLDLLGDSHHGLGRYDAAIEAYRQAAQRFQANGAPCSYALCLLKIAGSYLALRQPWHAFGYLEACLPLLRELGLVRHEGIARRQLEECRAAMAQTQAPWEGTGPRAAARTTTVPPGHLKHFRPRRRARVDSRYARH